MAIRLKPDDLRTGLGLLYGVSLVMALILVNWEPDSPSVAAFVAMGFIFVPMLAAFSLTLFIASFAFEDAADSAQTAESSLKKPEKPYFS